MKVTCPGCGWSAEVPEEKIPDGGITATCRKCQAKFEVVRQLEPEPKAMFDCPKCQFTQEKSEICVNCGFESPKYNINLDAVATIKADNSVKYITSVGIPAHADRDSGVMATAVPI